ncbi:MAG: RidA family protein, partial [Oscillospiraceae bacterium]|nr:RidA family protein [Oscillospiraceae bacterium]
MSCKVKAGEALETYKDAVRLAAANALTAARNKLSEGENLRVLSFWVYINAEDDFTAHAKLADYASEYLTEELGENGVAARAAIGMGTLPGVAPVEVQLVCGVV